MKANKIEQQIQYVGNAFAAGNFKPPICVAEALAFAECIFEYFPVKLQNTTMAIKSQLAKTELDGSKIFADYCDRLNIYSNLSYHDALDILMIYHDRLALEIYKDYYPLGDFSGVLSLDDKFFELISDHKLAAQECIHRYKKREMIKIGNKQFRPIQHQRLNDKCAMIIGVKL